MKVIYYSLFIIIIVLVYLLYSQRLNIINKSKKSIETFRDTTASLIKTDIIAPYKNSSVGKDRYNIVDIHDNVNFEQSINAEEKISVQSVSDSDVNFAHFDKITNNVFIGQNDINISFPEDKSVKFEDDVKISHQVIFNNDVEFLTDTQIDSKVLNRDNKNIFCFKNTDSVNCLTYSDLNSLKDMNVRNIDSLYFQSSGACLPSSSLVQKNFTESDSVNFTPLQDDMKCMYPEPGKLKLNNWYTMNDDIA